MEKFSGASELFIKNPHSILAALNTRLRDVFEVTLPRDLSTDETWKQIEAIARRNNVRVKELGERSESGGRDRDSRSDRGRKDRDRDRDHGKRKEFLGRESSHGAMIKPRTPVAIEELFKGIVEETRGVWLALDTLQDPQNLGAIFRSASFFGVRGIIMTAERSAPMTSTVYDISSGGVEAVPFAQVINLQRAFEVAKKSGMWILGTSEHAKEPLSKIQKDRPWLIVLGNEEKGIRRLTEEACDMTCTIPNHSEKHGVTSLNVSVATGILLSHFS